MRDLPRGTQVTGLRRQIVFVYRAVTLYGLPFLTVRLTIGFVTPPRPCRVSRPAPITPVQKRLQPITLNMVWAIPVSLATTKGIISFPPATEMFQFADLPQPGLFGSAWSDWALPQPGFPIRTPPDQCMLAAPRGISLPTTSFIGSWRQGIHLVPCVA